MRLNESEEVEGQQQSDDIICITVRNSAHIHERESIKASEESYNVLEPH